MKQIILIIILLMGANFHSKASVKKEKPNVIVILCDDMGFSDLGCTGSEIKTPNLDKMAKQGQLFTNFYNTSRCCPSRASILTGQYQWDAGMGHMDNDRSNLEEYQGYLNHNCITIAEALKEDGYHTFISGKWHVGHKEREMWPDHRGFDQFYGTPSGGGLYFYPSKFYDRPVYWNGKQVEPEEGWYSTDGFTDHAIKYIEQDRDKSKPFFMYLAYITPHFPLQAKKEDIAKYNGVYDKGYESIQTKRFNKQKQIGLLDKILKLPKNSCYDWSKVEDKEKQADKMEVYAAQIDCMDQNIGRVLNTLEKEGIEKNTIIMFLSDNGACSSNFNKTPEAELGTKNCNATYGHWHRVSNTPYKMAKKFEHEGGIITPLIVYWPGKQKKQNNIVHTPAHITDIMPTILEICSTSYPETYQNQILDPLDGISFYPLIKGKKINTTERIICWEHEGNKAIRKGNWKLVTRHKKEWELYNLKTDPFETVNLIDKHKVKRDELEGLYNVWATEHGVVDWPLKRKKK